MTQTIIPNVTSTAPDRFMQTLRQTLEHVDDSEWLDKRSPLASVFFAGATVSATRRRQISLTGLKGLDERLRAIWHSWEARPKSALQTLLWETVCQLPLDLDKHSQAILLLTYFEEPRPKQSEVIRLLALGRSTYYRYLEQAVEAVGETLVQTLRPALQLEQPTARPLIGRATPIAQAQQMINAGRVVHLVGGGGLGKTSLGAHLAAQWRIGAVFWYTFRPGLTDHLDQLTFALAYFLHEQGISGLWLYLNTNPQEVSTSKTLATLRQHLADIQTTPPLFCFDEVDLLLTDDLQDSDQHARLRAFLDDLIRAPRAGAPILLIGQKLLFEPDADCLITLLPLTAEDVTTLLRSARITLAGDQQQRLLNLTRGNPLLLQLFLALQRQGVSLAETLQQLTTPVTLEWFLIRLRQHLAPAEMTVLSELAVFDGNAPRDAWRTSHKAVRTLLDLGLVETLSTDKIGLHPALRALLYQQLSAERKIELHLAAASVLAERSRFTAAARHYMLGGQPNMAIWTWYVHRQTEINQGQASAALEIFAPLGQRPLARPDDQRALALLLAQLYSLAGRAQEGLAVLDQALWSPDSLSTAQAQERRGDLLTDTGEIERALAEYRRSLESVTNLRATQEIHLRLNIGRRTLWYMRDSEQARNQVLQARFDLEVLQGEIEDAAGHYTAARLHYTNALPLAAQLTSEHHLAKLHEGLGILESRYAHLETAVEHIQAAGRHYRNAGNLVCAVGVTNTNLSYAYLVKRRYADAVAPAQTALAFFTELNHPYWLALNEANLAEAYFYLGDLAKAETYAARGLQREEVVVRPYCLYILGHIQRAQLRFIEAEQFCREAIEAGETLQDPWALGPAWRALGETYRDADRSVEAHAAFAQVLTIYQRLGVDQEITFTEGLLAGLSVPTSAY
ncbi:MAG: tetratricopeptide repeat protein [Chloroflexi bacterium]|nr:tetratricopeptide repeat protein [Chloroflexota bacterium]